MNGVYFFIPFILVVSLGLGIENIHEAYPVSVEKGKNFDRELIGVTEQGYKQYRWTSIPFERINDNGAYQDYIFTETANSLVVETMRASVTLDKNTCGFSLHNKGLIQDNPTPLLTDSIVPYSKVQSLNNWSVVSQVDAASCQASWDGSELVATKHAPGIGNIQYKYILSTTGWKTQLEATNLTGLTDRVFGFDQTIDLNRDVVFFAGNQRNLDNYDSTTFDRTWLENNQGSVINFLNNYSFDLDIGFEYLDSISIQDTGINSSKLILHYMRNGDVLLPFDTLIIDPTYTSTSGEVIDGYIQTTTTTGTACSTTAMARNTSSGSLILYIYASATNQVCYYPWAEFDVTSIPDVVTIDSTEFQYDVTSASSARNCDFLGMDTRPSTAAIQDVLDSYGTSTVLVSNNSECTTASDNKSNDLGSAGNTYVQSQLASDWVGIGWQFNSMTRDGSVHNVYVESEDSGAPANPIPTLIVEYTDFTPDAVDDLYSPSQSFATIELAWTEPDVKGGTVEGYQINYSTPYTNNPDTIITNNTEDTSTAASVTGLAIGTPYSFRVSVWTTEGGNNATGNVVNVTSSGNFTIGTAVFNQTNNEVLPITFETQDINSTALFLNVTFSNAYDLACDFNYKYAINNQTYKDLDSYAVSTSLNETSFIFNNVTNEVIAVDCWDQNTGTDADYILTISDFVLLQQIENFRNGEYGTMGKIGIFDVVTLFVVIISMIGLNRVNESVGIVFNIALLGSLAYFGIIELPTVLFGVLALVMVFVITSTRKG